MSCRSQSTYLLKKLRVRNAFWMRIYEPSLSQIIDGYPDSCGDQCNLYLAHMLAISSWTFVGIQQIRPMSSCSRLESLFAHPSVVHPNFEQYLQQTVLNELPNGISFLLPITGGQLHPRQTYRERVMPCKSPSIRLNRYWT
jgi:hypothetical protein